MSTALSVPFVWRRWGEEGGWSRAALAGTRCMGSASWVGGGVEGEAGPAAWCAGPGGGRGGSRSGTSIWRGTLARRRKVEAATCTQVN